MALICLSVRGKRHLGYANWSTGFALAFAYQRPIDVCSRREQSVGKSPLKDRNQSESDFHADELGVGKVVCEDARDDNARALRTNGQVRN
jgi:hypothetical protein